MKQEKISCGKCGVKFLPGKVRSDFVWGCLLFINMIISNLLGWYVGSSSLVSFVVLAAYVFFGVRWVVTSRRTCPKCVKPVPYQCALDALVIAVTIFFGLGIVYRILQIINVI